MEVNNHDNMKCVNYYVIKSSCMMGFTMKCLDFNLQDTVAELYQKAREVLNLGTEQASWVPVSLIFS